METKHTPGPWEVVINGFNYEAVISSDGSYLTYSAGEQKPSPEREANARLISAAPDLLEALNSVLAGTGWRHIEPDALKAALAAINKATGYIPVSR